MSRSRKKRPHLSWHSTGGQKKFRTQENRAFRSRVRQQLHCGKYELFPHKQEYGNEWDSPRDGKCYRKLSEDDMKYPWLVNWFTKAMRK